MEENRLTLADDVDPEVDENQEELRLCRAAIVYGAERNGQRARLTISQEPDPTILKMTISEPEGPKGFKVSTLLVDLEAYNALNTVFSRYGTEAIKAPEEGRKRQRRAEQLQRLKQENEKLRSELEYFRRDQAQAKQSIIVPGNYPEGMPRATGWAKDPERENVFQAAREQALNTVNPTPPLGRRGYVVDDFRPDMKTASGRVPTSGEVEDARIEALREADPRD